MPDKILQTLVIAWTTTMAAATMFLAALAVSRVWDAAVFFRALRTAFLDP